MRLLWNILAVIGLVAVIALGVAFAHLWSATREFDPNAFGLYKEFMGQLMETGDIAELIILCTGSGAASVLKIGGAQLHRMY